ncbi:MAG TPA: hypothetical protein DIS79_11010 [Bacteroidetes bacterium]|nr:hypothetical protein [Bacteroidota bacterium]HRK05104.1 hypothetical protein [Chlorobiota bacterium]
MTRTQRVANVATSAVLLILLVTVAHGQGGSSYSAFGIGDIRRGVGAQYDAMAGTSIAMPTAYGINTINPALLGLATTTRLQASYRFHQHAVSFNGQSLAQNNGEIDGVLGMFSVDTAYGFGMMLGLVPISSVNYASTRTISRTVDGTTISGRSNQIGEGGLSALTFGAGVRPIHRLRFGLSVQALFGTSRYSDQVLIDVSGYGSVISSSTFDLRGVLFRGGVTYDVTDDLLVGAILAGGANGSTRETRRALGIAPGEVFYDTTGVVEISTGLPVTIGIGASYRSGKFLFGVDLETTDYSGVTMHPRPDATFGRSIHASFGVSRPGATQSNAPWLDRWGYHGGIGFDQSYIRVNTATVSDIYGAFGVSFPVGGAAMLDASIQAGIRQASASNLPSEILGRLYVSLSIGETWFKPFARD